MGTTRRLFVCLALVSGGFAVASCDPESPSPATAPRPSVRRADVAAPAIRAYTYAARAEFVKDMRRDLATINRALHDVFAKVESSEDAARTKAKTRAMMVALADEGMNVAAVISQSKDAEEVIWTRISTRCQKSIDDLRLAVAVARVQVDETLAR